MVSDINGNNGKCIDNSTRFVKYIQVFDDHIYYTGLKGKLRVSI